MPTKQPMSLQQMTILQQARRHACRFDSLERAEQFLKMHGIVTHGIERVDAPDGTHLDYVNLGDTYSTTICKRSYSARPYLISSWGTWYENKCNEYQKKTHTMRCGYCGHYTPKNRRNWQDVVCDSCGHNVNG